MLLKSNAFMIFINYPSLSLKKKLTFYGDIEKISIRKKFLILCIIIWFDFIHDLFFIHWHYLEEILYSQDQMENSLFFSYFPYMANHTQ